VDVRSGTLPPPDMLTFLNYCFNFSTFMMGPIQRFPEYRDQWNGASLAIPLTVQAHLDALVRILVGMLKAYVLAAWVEQFVLPFDVNAATVTTARLLTGIYAFYFYLYLSFAGYCDVVIGIGSLMGVRPPENFNSPFLATNISEFWLRQHRSLTLWLTDYIFSPLYKNLLGRRWFSSRPLFAANLSLLATMLVSGVWHGTTLSFLAFGLLHGVFFVIFRFWDAWLAASFGRKRVREWRAALPVRLGGMALTFHAAALAFVCFHHDISHALDIYARLLRL
jgi:alginate O-acetyltransferase complex protein AlgI